jgi:hypothetical protein
MDGSMVLLLVLAGLALFAVAAVLLGTDSRPGFEDPHLGRDIAT